MYERNTLASPIAAVTHVAAGRPRSLDAVGMLTAYIVVLFAIPSDLTIGALNSYGRPSLLLGLALLAWWLLSRLQQGSLETGFIRQPVRLAFGAFLIVVLVSFAAAMLRGQPADQINTAMSALANVMSWGGVLLVTIDGVRTMHDLTRLVRRLALAGGLQAALGCAQFFTHQSLLTIYSLIPGLSFDSGELGVRSGFLRASGTATHPLEFAVAITATLPLALVAATSRGFKTGRASWRDQLWWAGPAVIMFASLTAVSRSAIIGLAVAIVAALPALPKGLRAAAIGIAAVAAAVITVTVPGIFRTTLSLFTGAGDDASSESRTSALSKLGHFMSPSPVFGIGYGTFLPRYYIFDDQWALLLVELGIIGTLAFALLLATGLWSALRAATLSSRDGATRIARSLAASLVVVPVLFAFFDGLSFPISAGLCFLLLGLCASALTVATGEASRLPRRLDKMLHRSDGTPSWRESRSP